MRITLTVKDGPGAEDAALRHLNAWFTSGGHEPPFPPGTLLHYSLHRDQASDSTDEGTRAFLTRERPPRGVLTLSDVPWTVAAPRH